MLDGWMLDSDIEHPASSIQHLLRTEYRRSAAGRRRACIVRIRRTAVASPPAPPPRSAAASAAAAALARAEHLQPLADDFELRVLLAVLFPAVELEAAFDQHGRALAEVFVGDFRGAAPQRDVDERGFVDPLIAASSRDR